ncbi:MAG: glycine zipper 2TM domain-containing protein [Acidobacteria bacterium]|nr:MAG: glycine zipper 2TM domain-containing protein [Acidobacteriota bacterium]
MTTPLSSETSQPGDGFSARIVDDVVVDGRTVIPAGSVVEGFVKEVTSTSKKIGGTARLELDFDRLVLPDGETAAVRMAFVAAGKSQAGKDAATIGGAAAGGALLGRLLKKKDKSKGTLIGAILGGAIGAAIAANNPGDPVEIPEGTVLPVRLEDGLTVKLVDGRPTFSGTAP